MSMPPPPNSNVITCGRGIMLVFGTSVLEAYIAMFGIVTGSKKSGGLEVH